MAEPIGAVLIAGPTASGKSALAISLAQRLHGVVLNADAMQVYRDLRVLTARPSVAEEAAVPHVLYGHVDGTTNYSAGHFLADAARALDERKGGRRLPIFVGGTGLYLKALTEGLSRVPPVPQEVREAIRRSAEGRDTAALHGELMGRDPAMAALLEPTDRSRILRALEVLSATGRSLASFRGRKQPGPLAGLTAVRVFLAPDRGALRARIDARLRAMIVGGALEEVAKLGARDLDPALPIMRAHGVPQLIRHLVGETTLEDAIVEAQADTRRYAKRQFTWFRHQMPGWTWVAPELASGFIENQISEREISEERISAV